MERGRLACIFAIFQGGGTQQTEALKLSFKNRSRNSPTKDAEREIWKRLRQREKLKEDHDFSSPLLFRLNYLLWEPIAPGPRKGEDAWIH
ncbi:MAG: hypothetical protein D6820_06515 [Lentisphaerae bacterium]|nr:MAG: hypothetical protein D6820_06515 [Lentisphaerota bacterium]